MKVFVELVHNFFADVSVLKIRSTGYGLLDRSARIIVCKREQLFTFTGWVVAGERLLFTLCSQNGCDLGASDMKKAITGESDGFASRC